MCNFSSLFKIIVWSFVNASQNEGEGESEVTHGAPSRASLVIIHTS